MSRPDYAAANPKVAVFVSVHMIAMYVVREFSKIQTETAVEALRSTATPGEGAAAPLQKLSERLRTGSRCVLRRLPLRAERPFTS